eukprot:TRINITY_DN76312_c0_g1_i1.p1 TRINITY_DN76312_c0_g1~~TRINITY_DN76312_c0_g1_i1.p1  ORF type:complete len:676 (-),score=117.16 TRINITY_DN76312_c0_g1_i1:108-2135(-)
MGNQIVPCCSCNDDKLDVVIPVPGKPPWANGQIEEEPIECTDKKFDLMSNKPALLLHKITDQVVNTASGDNLITRLKHLLSWAAPLSPSQLQIIELTDKTCASETLIPDLLPEKCIYTDCVRTVDADLAVSTIRGSRALICGGVLEELLYPCNDLRRRAALREMAVVPQLCGSSGRSGELERASLISHLEEVLGVKLIGSVKMAAGWLLPEAQKPASIPHPLQIKLITDEGTVRLADQHHEIVSLLLPENFRKVEMTKIGKGWSSALKFFCAPTLVGKTKRESTIETRGATTFIKLGPEDEIAEELKTTNHVNEILGNFSPQVLGYAELGEEAAINLGIAAMGTSKPNSFCDLYTSFLESEASSSAEGILHERIQECLTVVFRVMLKKLHAGEKPDLLAFSVADELGLLKDAPGGKTGVESEVHMSSGWVLEKVWKKKPGDGVLASSVQIHAALTLGEESAKGSELKFANGLALPNLCTGLLRSHSRLAKLRAGSTDVHRICFVHGDLHGDNIMVDDKDNHFLIDFGKTGFGYFLEDYTWLESFVMLSYTGFDTDSELNQALELVLALAPASGFTVESFDRGSMEAAAARKPTSPTVRKMWQTILSIRSHMARAIRSYAESTPSACASASLLWLRNSIFFLAARENKEQTRRRQFALALACAYARTAEATCDSSP